MDARLQICLIQAGNYSNNELEMPKIPKKCLPQNINIA